MTIRVVILTFGKTNATWEAFPADTRADLDCAVSFAADSIRGMKPGETIIVQMVDVGMTSQNSPSGKT